MPFWSAAIHRRFFSRHPGVPQRPTALGRPFQRRDVGGLVGQYFPIGQVGDFYANAVRSNMGPLSHGGSAARGILCQQAKVR